MAAAVSQRGQRQPEGAISERAVPDHTLPVLAALSFSLVTPHELGSSHFTWLYRQMFYVALAVAPPSLTFVLVSQPVLTTSTHVVAWPHGDQVLSGGPVAHKARAEPQNPENGTADDHF